MGAGAVRRAAAEAGQAREANIKPQPPLVLEPTRNCHSLYSESDSMLIRKNKIKSHAERMSEINHYRLYL